MNVAAILNQKGRAVISDETPARVKGKT